MLNILPNIWINPDAIEALHFEKDRENGDRLIIHMISGKTYEVVEKINEIMREIEKLFESKTGVEAKQKKERKPRKKKEEEQVA